MNNQSYTEVNAKAIDKWVENGWEWSVPISHEDFLKAKDGQWREVPNTALTPLKPVPIEWYKPF